MPLSFDLYNTLQRKVLPFTPIEEGKIGLYVCGNTVNDHAHIGHARAMVVYDALVRTLRCWGWDVRFVRNFTDIDDKIIYRAAEKGEDPIALAQRYIDSFREDTLSLGLIQPDVEPRVTEHIEDIIAFIQRLIERGHAYVSDGNVWFNVSSFPRYGSLSGQQVDQLRNPDVAEGKRSPQDFALWKSAKEGEVSWTTEWGSGRPGWHIECSAMSCRHLGETFDIHGGGLDLVFPHHENEIAQSECASEGSFARWWMHNGLLTVGGGLKMGKSLGNMILIKDALESFPAEAIKLYLLQSHYRSPIPWGPDALPDALGILARLYDARELAESFQGEEDPQQLASSLGEEAAALLELGQSLRARIEKALREDFNTSLALGHALELARAINRFAQHKKARKRGGPLVREALEGLSYFATCLGILAQPCEAFQEELRRKRLQALGLTRAELESLLEERRQARAERDWARADALRDQLSERGILLMDGSEGAGWRVRL